MLPWQQPTVGMKSACKLKALQVENTTRIWLNTDKYFVSETSVKGAQIPEGGVGGTQGDMPPPPTFENPQIVPPIELYVI